MRKFKTNTTWPDKYYADIPVKSRSTGQKIRTRLPFLLVFELLFQLAACAAFPFKDLLEFPPESGFARKKAEWCNTFNVPQGILVFPIGIHGDGVPFGNNTSMECYSWNICSIDPSERNLFTCIGKRDLCDCGCSGRCTIDAILEVFLWDMLCCARGERPTFRHDRKAWHPKEDKSRASKSGPLGFRAYLSQCRGDWPWFKSLFGFKGWAGKNVCWRCKANRSNIPFTDPSARAKWRKSRLSTAEFNLCCEQNGFPISPLFAIPLFTIENICIDVLHACDLGFTQEVLGSLFFESLGTFATGPNRKEQVADLHRKMVDHYKRMGTSNRIFNLTPEMIKAKSKPPKLRAKGAETRHLVPFGLEVATALHAAHQTTHSFTMLQCVSALMDFYMCMGTRPFPAEHARNAVRNCCIFFVSLHEEAESLGKQTWRVKPKMHLFQELGEFQTDELGDPMSFWAYRDEDYVGLIASVGFSRGGANNATTAPERIIDRLRILSSM